MRKKKINEQVHYLRNSWERILVELIGKPFAILTKINSENA